MNLNTKMSFVILFNLIVYHLYMQKRFNLHIDEDKIPKDMSNGIYIQFEVSRTDIWYFRFKLIVD